MAVLLLAGPPAVGHNTIAELVCQLRPRVALVDCDDVRALVRRPTKAAPWAEDEGERQYRLGIRNACALTRGFDANGWDVVLLDVAPPETLDLYRAELASVSPLHVVLLHAEAEVCVARDLARDPNPHPDPEALASWHTRIRFLREQLVGHADRYDCSIDTGIMSAAEAASVLAGLLEG